MTNNKIYEMTFSKVYPLLIAKVEKKGRTRNEMDEITCWLTGYSKEQIADLASHEATMCIFLGIHMIEEVVQDLLVHYSEDTAVAVVQKATWPEEIIIRGTLKDISKKVEEAVAKAEKGEISEEEAKQAIEKIEVIDEPSYEVEKL